MLYVRYITVGYEVVKIGVQWWCCFFLGRVSYHTPSLSFSIEPFLRVSACECPPPTATLRTLQKHQTVQ